MKLRSDMRSKSALLTVIFTTINATAFAFEPPEPKTLVSFAAGFEWEPAQVHDADATRRQDGSVPVLQVDTRHAADWPGITFKAPPNHWDLSAYLEIGLHVKNVDSKPVTVYCRVDGPGGDGEQNSLNGNVRLGPGEQKLLRVPLSRQLPAALANKLYGMRGYPGGAKPNGIDVTEVTQVIVYVDKPTHDHSFQLSEIRARGSYPQGDWSRMSAEEFFPMIDQFGQFVHGHWPGKVDSADELSHDIQAERQDLTAHPGPDGWTEYGGWRDGPQLEATGFFYPVKYRDKWWLVDPLGRLFWSHGVDCVGFTNGTTPVSDREFYFAELPANDSPLAGFYGSGSWAPHGYYQNKRRYRTFNFTGANLMRKFGDDWHDRAAGLAHERLRSWSMNTIANWSDSGIYGKRKTPYVVAVSSGRTRPIEGSRGYWRQFPDPFDPSFRRALDRRLAGEKDKSAGDPWCIGYFVDNELGWGDELSLAIAALASPPDQPAKQVIVVDLRKKYAAIATLNDAWGTAYDSWDALAESRTPPDEKYAKEDLGAFATKIAEAYFRHCHDAVKQVAPDNLYLGCRFAWVNDRGARAAAKYCDVLGYNLYRDDVADFELPEGVDKPVIVGEFHFGALDRGMFHTGLRPTASQEDRARAYRNYVTSALQHPSFVGTHWFQFGDQATTGRGDGENYQIGLVNICDRPYPETIAAVREVGDSMYATRMGRGKTGEASD